MVINMSCNNPTVQTILVNMARDTLPQITNNQTMVTPPNRQSSLNISQATLPVPVQIKKEVC